MPQSTRLPKMRSDKFLKPRQGDTSLFDQVAPETAASSAASVKAPIRQNKPDFFAEPKRGKGKVYRWYEVRGARTLNGKHGVWVHACSDDDACGTYRFSKLYRKSDSDPVPTGRTKTKLETNDYGFVREDGIKVVEVNWKNVNRIITDLQKAREKRRAARERQRARRKRLREAA